MSRSPEISFMPFQNASSRLTLVLWPATTIERFTTGDFKTRPRRRYDADRVVHWSGRYNFLPKAVAARAVEGDLPDGGGTFSRRSWTPNLLQTRRAKSFGTHGARTDGSR